MPPNSDSVPLIALFYLGSMLIISLATTGTVITLHIHKRGDYRKPMSKISKIIFFKCIARIFCIEIVKRSRVQQKEEIEELYGDKKTIKTSSSMSSTSKIYNLDKLRNKKAMFSNDDSSNHTSALIKKQHLNKTNNSSFNDGILLSSDNYKRCSYNEEICCKSCRNNAFSDLFLIEQKRFSKLIKALNKNLEDNEFKNDTEQYYEDIKWEWAQLAKVVDTLFAFTFFSFTFFILLCVVYFYLSYH